MSTSEWDRLEHEVKQASSDLKHFPRSPGGLASDQVRSSPEYQAAKARYNVAFANLRAFNAKKRPIK